MGIDNPVLRGEVPDELVMLIEASICDFQNASAISWHVFHHREKAMWSVQSTLEEIRVDVVVIIEGDHQKLEVIAHPGDDKRKFHRGVAVRYALSNRSWLGRQMTENLREMRRILGKIPAA